MIHRLQQEEQSEYMQFKFNLQIFYEYRRINVINL
uniref:Uncharacterized protein n=1 Tax=Arundo donax TaxID=35708 RepID=A0A0A8XVZ9_ARUDO